MDDVPMHGTGPDAAGDYAGRLFDHHIADGVIPRLIFWEGLERGAATAADAARAGYHEQKVARFQELVPGLDRTAAGELLLTIVSLVNAWPVLGHRDGFIVGTGSHRTAERRAALVASVTAIARAVVDGATRAGDPDSEVQG
jgi:hypothetical protein